MAEALRERGASVTFAAPERAETRLLRDAGFEVDPFSVRGIPRSVGLAAARAIAEAARAIPACRAILRRRRPDVVLGGGGYVAGPMVAAARTLGIPAALTEADAYLGLANRLAAPLADRVLLAYPLPGRRPPKYRVVGRPIPRRSLAAVDRDAARAAFGLPLEGPVVLVAGGSQGSRALNEAAVAAWADAGPAVLHLCGTRDHEALAPRVARPAYRLVAFTDDFGAALAAADLAVSRAGGSVFELAAAGLPAILVPFPYATADHQTRNARWFAEGGGALLVPEPQLDLARQAGELLADPARLARMGEAMRRLARPRAAEDVAEELIALAAARR